MTTWSDHWQRYMTARRDNVAVCAAFEKKWAMKPISRDSLSGQNSPGRRSGARSSRALSTIFKKLQKLDREIGVIDRIIGMDAQRAYLFNPGLAPKRAKLDAKRSP